MFELLLVVAESTEVWSRPEEGEEGERGEGGEGGRRGRRGRRGWRPFPGAPAQLWLTAPGSSLSA